ncbi:hypothetical protein THAOC_22027, partial [Thalassiosira oceanica]
ITGGSDSGSNGGALAGEEPSSSSRLKPDHREICSICLDVYDNPVQLPCGHSFCEVCLDGWLVKSKFDVRQPRNCPVCRHMVKPSREIISKLKTLSDVVSVFQEAGHEELEAAKTEQEDLLGALLKMGYTSEEIGDMVDEYRNSIIELPYAITTAAGKNDAQTVLYWLGSPVDEGKLTSSVLGMTLLRMTALGGHKELSSLLLQYGAAVDVYDAKGATPIALALEESLGLVNEIVTLLYEWGASLEHHLTGEVGAIWDVNLQSLPMFHNEFVKRRCDHQPEPTQGSHRPDVTTEHAHETFLVGRDNLKRRDRTPDDPGYYVTFEDGEYKCHTFSSNEECQEFVRNLRSSGREAVHPDGTSRRRWEGTIRPYGTDKKTVSVALVQGAPAPAETLSLAAPYGAVVGLTAIAAKEQAIDNKSYDDGLRRDDELRCDAGLRATPRREGDELVDRRQGGGPIWGFDTAAGKDRSAKKSRNETTEPLIRSDDFIGLWKGVSTVRKGEASADGCRRKISARLSASAARTHVSRRTGRAIPSPRPLCRSSRSTWPSSRPSSEPQSEIDSVHARTWVTSKGMRSSALHAVPRKLRAQLTLASMATGMDEDTIKTDKDDATTRTRTKAEMKNLVNGLSGAGLCQDCPSEKGRAVAELDRVEPRCRAELDEVSPGRRKFGGRSLALPGGSRCDVM